MNRKSEEYRFARIEALHITLARLEGQFRDKAVNLDEMEAAADSELANEAPCAPWRQSEAERAGCREGVRLAVSHFISQYREALQNLKLNGPA